MFCFAETFPLHANSTVEEWMLSLRFGQLMNPQEAMQMNALQLAYLGDSVWEMIVRYELVLQKYNVHHLHERSVQRVNAAAQAALAARIRPLLNEEEEEIFRRGRNANSKHPAPRNQRPDDYSLATGFEAVWGYLYITGQDERIAGLVKIVKELEKENG